MSPYVSYCKNCTYKFNLDEFDRCPSCDHQGSSPSKRGRVGVSQTVGSANNIQVEAFADLDDLVSAQNRTTYAVRSLALYLFITMTTSFIGILLLYLVPSSPITGSLIIIAGSITAIFIGIAELTQSKP
jgi:hypothetical protein